MHCANELIQSRTVAVYRPPPVVLSNSVPQHTRCAAVRATSKHLAMTAAPCACVRIPAGVIAQVSTSLSVSAEIVALLTSDERTQVRRGCAPNNSRIVGGTPTVLPRFFVRPFGLRSGECAC